MKQLIVTIFLLAGLECANAQQDTSSNLGEVIITGIRDSRPSHSSLNIEPYPLRMLEAKLPLHLSDALAAIPGINQITTGGAISKPVIRGLYGNRILVLLSGARFDNQQWQDEHGLGLSQIGIDRVEVIKGPASLLYGTDALGGVINIIEERPTPGHPRVVDATLRSYGNTLGMLADVGIRRHHGKHWERLRLGYENHGDYTDGKGQRVLNSRNTGYYLKAGLGFDRPHWIQQNSYNASFNQYGFILEELNTFFSPDARWSRRMAGPHHNVMLHVLNSQNTFYLDRSTLKVHLGAQSNLRQEDEGGGQISLNMHLFSLLETMRWEKNLRENLLLTLNHQFTFENNTNYGGRIIVPDANMAEATLSAFLRRYARRLIIEAGLGGNYKLVQTFQTRQLNGPDREIKPFERHRPSANGMLGAAYNPNPYLTLKSNVSTGFRVANLAELSSNGLHEGSYRYEIGNPDQKVEQNLCADVSMELTHRTFSGSVSAYYNRFFHYIYLAPTDETWLSVYQVYRYRQQHARLYGGELSAQWKPAFWPALQWKESIALTRGILDDGAYLPFIPPYRIVSAIRWARNLSRQRSFYLEPEFEYVGAQERPAQFETSTPAYHLLHLHAGWSVTHGKTQLDWTFSGKNLLNEAYADHLSRIKQYGLLNPGINLVIALKATFGG